MKILPKGGNALLTDTGSVRVELRWNGARGSLDVVCCAVADDGRVPSDDWCLFYNQLQSPDEAIRVVSTSVGQTDLLLQLERLPAQIQRCVFAAALERGHFRDLVGATLTASAPGSEVLGFTLTEAGDEQALIFAEIYRHKSAWKFRAIGQGFRGGLQPLAEHFGVTVSAAPPAPIPLPTPLPEPRGEPVPEPAREPSPPPADARRSARRFPLKTLLALLLLAGGAGALWFWNPSLLEHPDLLWKALRTPLDRAPDQPPTAYQPPICDWSNDQVFERYHALGESYVKILKRIDYSNQRLTQWRTTLTRAEGGCPTSFLDDNRREIAQLQELPIADWLNEATRLNLCAGLIIKKIDAELNNESRPIIIQRLVHDADRARNLESDLTNISRDLAYLRNKTARLVDGFTENLDACP